VGGCDVVVHMMGVMETSAAVVGATVVGGAVLTMGATVEGLSDCGVMDFHVSGRIVVGFGIDGAIDAGTILGIGVLVLGNSDVVVSMTVVSVGGSGVGVVVMLEEGGGEVVGFCVGIGVFFAVCFIDGTQS